MRAQEKRSADRVPCSVPVRVECRLGSFRGTIRDLSRVGAGLQVPLAQLGHVQEMDLLKVADLIETYLHEWFRIELHAPGSDRPVRKPVRIRRLVRMNLDTGIVQLGCEFGSALTDEEAARVAVELPALRSGLRPVEWVPMRPSPDRGRPRSSDAVHDPRPVAPVPVHA